MKCVAVSILAACLLAAPVAAASAGSPVEKVVDLLKDLQAKISHDGSVEEQAYNKYACWCDKTTERKAKAIENAQDQLRALGQAILKLKGKIATLTAEIEELAQKIKENLAAQEDATTLRAKENGEYQASTAELKDALAAMEKAVTVLIKGSSLLQEGSGTSATRAALRTVLQKLPRKSVLSPDKAATLSEFLQTTTKYAPQSATIQGILKDMYDTFGSDLESETRTEAKANREFELFIEVKTKELAEFRETKAAKEEQKAAAEELLAETTQEYDDTEAQMKADIEFFDATKVACEAKHAAWTVRDGLRKEELEGIAKAIGILTTDEARAMFAKSIKPGKETGTGAQNSGVDIADSFLQVDEYGSMSAPVARAFAALKASAGKAHSLRLASLAVQIRAEKAGHFDKVISAINAMIQLLKDEEAADIAKRDQCKDEYKNTASVIADVTWKIKVNDATIDKLEALIEKRTADKAQTIEDIREVESQIAAMEAQRKTENDEFLQAKSDDAAAIELLMQARTVLGRYSKKNEIDMGPIQGSVKGAMLQAGPDFAVSEDQAPDFEFSGKGNRKGMSKGIVSIMTMLIEDLNDEIKNGMKDEEAAQMEFEKALNAAKKLKAELEEKKVNLEDAIAARTEEKDEEHRKKASNEADLQDEVDYKKSITPDCDWILKAFQGRDDRRAAEMNGLVEAKSYLAGAAVPEFLQKAKGASFDDAALSKINFLGINK